MSRFALDASALIALFNSEPGAIRVAELLPDSAVSAVNLAEVCTKVVDSGQSLREFERDFAGFRVRVIPFDGVLASESGRLRMATRSWGLSLGDRACLATASLNGLTAVTTDRVWADLALPIRVEVIR